MLPTSFRTRYNRADAEERLEILDEYMQAKTQFLYSTAGKAEFLRSAGPMFAMFTKWPASIASDIFLKAENRQYAKIAAKYITPYLVFQALNDALLDQDPRTGYTKEGIGKFVFGPRGLVAAQPVGAAMGLPKMEIGPPLVQSTVGTAAEVLNKPITEDAIWEALQSTLKVIVPGAGAGIAIKKLYKAIEEEKKD
jgi:hypothetical protein